MPTTDPYSGTYDEDPFTLTIKALWQLLEGHPGFAEKVKPGNRIKYHEQPRTKDAMAKADTPEVRIVADELDPRIMRTSNGSSFVRDYRFEIRTDDLRITAQAFPTEWVILQAVAEGMTQISQTGGLPDLPFIKRIQAVPGEVPGPDPSQRSRGWHTVLIVQVECWFRTADMLQTP